ncbi:MAG: hypothetical protein ACR2M3_17495 [Thermomicrobiales bacterium]
MRQQHMHGRFIFFSLGVAIALVIAMTTWVAADTTPTPAGVNTPVTFTGAGFAPNEILSVWETDSGGVSTVLTPTQSDGTGGFTTTVSFPSAGLWTVTAHSLNNDKEFVGNYTVGSGSGTTTTPVPGAPVTSPSAVTSPSSGATATGAQVGIGAPVTFSGTGFTANEAISVWETGPDSKVTALPTVHADNNGAFTTSVSFPSAGQWQVTAQGVASSHQVITPFAVGTAGSASSPVTNGPATGVPPVTSTGTVGGSGFNGTAANIGTAVSFSGSGFTANEAISVWETPPDNSPVTALPSVQADTTGAFTDSVTFPSAGNWQVTAQGHASAHQVIGRYAVTDPSSTTSAPSTASATATTTPVSSSTFTSPFTDVPVKATAGTEVTYTATGFNAGEMVTAWITPPDGSAVTPLPSVQASSTGRATVSTPFGTAGLWQITLHGRDSGHQVVGKYQVSAS